MCLKVGGTEPPPPGQGEREGMGTLRLVAPSLEKQELSPGDGRIMRSVNEAMGLMAPLITWGRGASLLAGGLHVH